MFSSNVVLTPGKLAETVDYFMQDHIDVVSFDFETSGAHRGVPYRNSASWLGIAGRGRTAVIPFNHPIGSKVTGIVKEPRQQANGIKMFKVPVYEGPPSQLDRAEVFEALRPVFWSDKVKVGHGMQFDLATGAKYYGDEIMPGPYCDTIVLRWLLDENRKQYGLKAITKGVYGFNYDDENVGKCVEKYPFNMVAHYLYCDVMYPLFEYQRLRPMITREGLERVYELEMSLLPILARMRLTGMAVDEDRLRGDARRPRATCRAGGEQDLRGGRPSVQHQRVPAEAGGAVPSEERGRPGPQAVEAHRRCQEEAEDRPGVQARHLRLEHRRRRPGDLRRQPRGRRPAGLPGVVQAAPHVRPGVPRG